MKDDYVSLKLPRELIEEVDKEIGKGGFRSRSEIIKYAIRRYLETANAVQQVEEAITKEAQA